MAVLFPGHPTQLAGLTVEASLSIDGMTCQHCQQAVERALAQVPGVLQVKVDLAAKSAWVQGDWEPAALREAVEEAGFTLVSLE